MRDWRSEPCRLHHICWIKHEPLVFLFPRTALVCALQSLIVHFPTHVATVRQIFNARLVTSVGIVVNGEEIAKVIEREFLRIAQPAKYNLKIGAIEFAAKYGSARGILQHGAFFGANVVTAITNAPVQATIHSKNKTMHVVAAQTCLHAKAREHFLAHFGNAVTVLVLKAPQVWNASHKHTVANLQHASGGAIKWFVQLARKIHGSVRYAAAFCIRDVFHTIRILGVPIHSVHALACPLCVNRQAIFNSAGA